MRGRIRRPLAKTAVHPVADRGQHALARGRAKEIVRDGPASVFELSGVESAVEIHVPGPSPQRPEGPVVARSKFLWCGEEKLYVSKVKNHNAMFDNKGRVWLASAVRGPKNPMGAGTQETELLKLPS